MAEIDRKQAEAATIETYDRSARALAEYFKGIGARVDDIERALELAGAAGNIRVLEIGCGDGRDAKEIVKRVGWYRGIDPSTGLIELAKNELPEVEFVLADAQSYEYPENLDVIFAFASLLHVSKESLPLIFQKAMVALKSGGVFYVSLKERDEYIEEIKKDDYGERIFYFYTPDLIVKLAGNGFETVHVEHQLIGNTKWFTIALKKK